jgi:hypothetical protein
LSTVFWFDMIVCFLMHFLFWCLLLLSTHFWLHKLFSFWFALILSIVCWHCLVFSFKCIFSFWRMLLLSTVFCFFQFPMFDGSIRSDAFFFSRSFFMLYSFSLLNLFFF